MDAREDLAQGAQPPPGRRVAGGRRHVRHPVMAPGAVGGVVGTLAGLGFWRLLRRRGRRHGAGEVPSTGCSGSALERSAARGRQRARC
jgi:hypothetical protein